MKALSLRQPWAAAVLHLGKTIENRRWGTSFRGEFLIHAAKAMSREDYSNGYEFCADVFGLPRIFEVDVALDFFAPNDRLNGAKLPKGAIVGRAELVGVVPPRAELVLPGVETHYPESHRGAWRWHMREQSGFLLANVVAFTTPIPWPGMLGFFDAPFDRDGHPTGIFEDFPERGTYR